jgi:glycopeptide antibiotics resistance protein
MNWRKIGRICAISYLFLYLAAMVMPRKIPSGHKHHHVFSIKRLFHEILYYGGPLEPVANFLFLIPIFGILLVFLGKSRAFLAASTCIVISATAESLQHFIPGRVSSLGDFALNSGGAITAFLLYKFFGSRKVNL